MRKHLLFLRTCFATSFASLAALGCGAAADTQRADALTGTQSEACTQPAPTPPAPPPRTVADETGAVCTSDTSTLVCARYDVPVPSGLAGYGCTLGLQEQQNGVDVAYIFACPVGVPFALPPLGLLTPTAPNVHEIAVTSPNKCDPCVGLPLPGWTLVEDSLFSTRPVGCHGACGVILDPDPGANP